MSFYKSIAAGLMIGIAGMIYIAVGGGIIGAVLFTLGLMSVMLFNLNLYTGKVARIECYNLGLISVALGNFIGAWIAALLAQSHDTWIETAKTMAETKISKPDTAFMVDAIVCGICIGVAVRGFEKAGVWITLLAVMAFILSGAEHVVADTFYFATAGALKAGAWKLLICLVGNTAGGAIVSSFMDLRGRNGKTPQQTAQ